MITSDMIMHYPSDTPISFSQFDNRCYSNRNDVLRSDEEFYHVPLRESTDWIDTDARIDTTENRKKRYFFGREPDRPVVIDLDVLTLFR